MTQEEQDILLRDLCSRQPYGVKGRCELDASYDTEFDSIYQTHCFDAELIGIKDDIIFVIPLIEDEDENIYTTEEVIDGIDILDFTPYLRPMSSMTEEEKDEYDRLVMCNASWVNDDWLNAHHIDYRGLIPMGLAIEVTEENNPYEN